ncbi:MAG: tetratricopeptide repeat protein [Deltaproteobacteria bacterium]|jgi:type III secretion system low calcium response chaperone LcrH/SycD|nr:tetratricopeptide repeat protein [Deltaproteobacteria bacterium]
MTTSPASAQFTSEQLAQISVDFLSTPSLAELSDLGSERLEALYLLGHSLYIMGEYEDALTAFKALCVYEQREARFWLGLGAIYQATNKLSQAVDAYLMCSISQGFSDPYPMLLSGQCLLKQLNKPMALAAWTAASEMGGEGPTHTAIRERAKNLIAAAQNYGTTS